jgi:hypothetical protein
MNPRRTTLLALFALFSAALAPAPGAGQTPVAQGDVVRVWIDGREQPVEGVFSRSPEGGIEIRTTSDEAVALDPRTISLTHRQVTGTHGGLGAVVGSITGLVLGIVLFDNSCGSADAGGRDPVTAVVSGAVECAGSAFVSDVLAPAGTALVGGGVGHLVGRSIETTGWVPSVLPPGPGSGVTLSWRIPAGR